MNGVKEKLPHKLQELIGGVSRNAVIGKAHRLNLSIKIKKRKCFLQYPDKNENQ